MSERGITEACKRKLPNRAAVFFPFTAKYVFINLIIFDRFIK